jgi:hypothetical protein
MSYAVICMFIANAVCIPIMGLLLWQMGIKNWIPWLLVIPAIALPDIDHFIFTNFPGFSVHPTPGAKILHFSHTIEFVIIEIAFFIIDGRHDRSIHDWLFPHVSDYTSACYYYLAWAVRIIMIGVVIHWIFDIIIYTYFNKWDYLYISLVQYFINPS